MYIYKIVFIYAQSFYSFKFNKKKSFIFAAAETKKTKINIGVHGYANWLGRGTILQGGDRNTNECGGGNFFFCLYQIKNIYFQFGNRKIKA